MILYSVTDRAENDQTKQSGSFFDEVVLPLVSALPADTDLRVVVTPLEHADPYDTTFAKRREEDEFERLVEEVFFVADTPTDQKYARAIALVKAFKAAGHTVEVKKSEKQIEQKLEYTESVFIPGGDVSQLKALRNKLNSAPDALHDRARAPENADEMDGWIPVQRGKDVKDAWTFDSKMFDRIKLTFSNEVIDILQTRGSKNRQKKLVDLNFDLGIMQIPNNIAVRNTPKNIPAVAFENYYDAKNEASSALADDIVGLRALGPVKKFDMSVVEMLSPILRRLNLTTKDVSINSRALPNDVDANDFLRRTRQINQTKLEFVDRLVDAFWAGKKITDVTDSREIVNIFYELNRTTRSLLVPKILVISPSGWQPSRSSRKSASLSAGNTIYSSRLEKVF